MTEKELEIKRLKKTIKNIKKEIRGHQGEVIYFEKKLEELQGKNHERKN